MALKTIQRWAPSASILRRFQNESQLLGRLQHPGIGQIFEARVHNPGDGGAAVPSFVMEFLRGESVTPFIRTRALPIAERLGLFIRICDAVAYAHDQGVVHRDIKPDNILVDSTGQPKILDFGIAKSTDADFQVLTIETGVGQLVGTLPYLSPEQVAGHSAQIDRRSDVYSLGVLLYELLANRLPHDIRNQPLPDAVRIISDENHTHLSSVDRSFRGDLETIVSKALEKPVGRRYQSVTELAGVVQRFLAHEPITARPPSTFYQLSKFATRNRSLVLGVVGVFVALLLGVIGTTRSALLAAAPLEHREWEWDFLHRRLEQWEVEIDCGSRIEGGLSIVPSSAGTGSKQVVAALEGGEGLAERIGVWDIESREPVREIPIVDGISRIARHPSGALVVVLTKRGALVVVDADGAGEDAVEDQRWEASGEPPVAPAEVNDVAISPDGHTIFVAARSVLLACDRVLELRDHSSYIKDIAFSPDGSQIATASGDRTVRVWDSRSKEERYSQIRAGVALRNRMRPSVLGMLGELKGKDAVAAALRADTSLTADERRAALRVLLELSGEAPE